MKLPFTFHDVFILFNYIVIFFLLDGGIYVLFNISKYFSSKSSQIIQETGKITLEKKLLVTDTLLKMIDDSILREFGPLVQRFALLQQDYPLTRIDEDVSQIATIIFESFKKEIFSSEELCLTEDYLLKYITERTKSLAITTVWEYNMSRHGNFLQMGEDEE